MFRKIAIASMAAFTLGIAALGSPAESRPFYSGGGYHYWHGGWGHGGGWNNGWGWGAAGLVGGLALSPLLFGNGYGGGYGGGYGYGNGYGYPSGGYYEGPACSWQTIQVHTRYGWRRQRARVCH
jgi:hypothetical protein